MAQKQPKIIELRVQIVGLHQASHLKELRLSELDAEYLRQVRRLQIMFYKFKKKRAALASNH